MKREVDVNNFNLEWIRAWDGNKDMQVCKDYHAVITYITYYFSKDESGTLDFLKKQYMKMHTRITKNACDCCHKSALHIVKMENLKPINFVFRIFI